MTDGKDKPTDGKPAGAGGAKRLPKRTILGVPLQRPANAPGATPAAAPAPPAAAPKPAVSLASVTGKSAAKGDAPGYKPRAPSRLAQPGKPAPLKRDPTLVGIPRKPGAGAPKQGSTPETSGQWVESGAKATDPALTLPRRIEQTVSMETDVLPPSVSQTGRNAAIDANAAAETTPDEPAEEAPGREVYTSDAPTAAAAFSLSPDELVELDEDEGEEHTVAGGALYEAEARTAGRSVPAPPSSGRDAEISTEIEIGLPARQARPEPPELAPTVVDTRGPEMFEAPTTEDKRPAVRDFDTSPTPVGSVLGGMPMNTGELTIDEEKPRWFKRPVAWVLLIGGIVLLAGLGLGASMLLEQMSGTPTTAPTTGRGTSATPPAHAPTGASVAPTTTAPAAPTAPAPTDPAVTEATDTPSEANGGEPSQTATTAEVPVPPAAVRKLPGSKKRAKARAARSQAGKAERAQNGSALEEAATHWLWYDPQSSSASAAMAEAHYLQKHFPLALAWAERAIELSPRISAYHATRARILSALGQSSDAAEACKRAAVVAKRDAVRKACLASLPKP
ncbi:MAG: hypothetical protein R3A78_03470 [Polyangiales bacterium]|nr:hypothetical protein [Myxococcales bacterium]